MDERRAPPDAEYWLVLVHAPGLSPAAMQLLLDHFPSPRHVCTAGAGRLQGLGLKPETITGILHPDRNRILADLAWLEIPGHHLLTRRDPAYPPLLSRIADPPPVLYVKGNRAALGATHIAVVGSRTPSPGGRRIARELASQLGLAGLCVTSGLALGIDGAAHEGALDAGAATVAVMGHGLNTIYPAAHRGLAARICEAGALVSEFPVDYRPMPSNFPRRNRIISGLSAGTLVVEAALKSGSLITARLALEQGREVFAVPGSIRNPLARGCHALIRDGAKLTENLDDILEEILPLALAGRLPGGTTAGDGVQIQNLDEAGKLLLDHIGYEPVTIDCLIEETGMAANDISAALLNLELNDLIESRPGGSFIRKH